MTREYALLLWGDLVDHRSPLYVDPQQNEQQWLPTFQVRLDANVGDDINGVPSNYYRIRVVQRYGDTLKGMAFILDRVAARLDPGNTTIEPENNGLLIC